MKIYCNKSELSQALNNISNALPTRTTSKILESILIEVKENKMLLTATDTNITIESQLAITSDGDISFAVPAKLFSNIIRKQSENDILLIYNEKNELLIKCGNSEAKLLCESPDEFPKMKTADTKTTLSLDKNTVKQMINKTSFSASFDEVNGILVGVLIEICDKKIRMVAIDSFRMAVYNSDTQLDNNISLIVDAKLLQKVSRIISEDTENNLLNIDMSESKAVFRFDNNKITVNTLNGKFIDYKKIISKNNNIKIRVKTDDLSKSIDRASLLSSEVNNNLIKFNITDEILDITSLSDEGNINEKVEVIKEGEDINIGFNSKYLIDILKVIDDEEIMMYMETSVSPCIIKPLKGDKYLYLVLPVRIS